MIVVIYILPTEDKREIQTSFYWNEDNHINHCKKTGKNAGIQFSWKGTGTLKTRLTIE
jgi:hypothetical protein